MHTPQDTSHTQNPAKRTIQFGLIGVLAILPYALVLVLDSWRGRVVWTGVVLRNSDALLYSYIDRMLPFFTQPVIIFVFVFCWALALGLAVRMVYFAWRGHPLKGRPRRVFLLEVTGRAVVVIAAALLLAGPGMDAFYVYPPEGVTLLMSSYGGALGPVALYSLPMAQLAAYAFTVGVVIYAAVSAPSFRLFAARSAAGLAVMIAVMAGVYACSRYLDLGKYLDSVPGVTMKPEPRKLVVLSNPPAVYRFDDSFNDCSVSESFCRKIPSSDVNAKAVKTYVESRGYRTGLRGAAFNLMALNRLRDLDPAGALAVDTEALRVTGDVTQGISAMARIIYSPATEPYRKVLDKLADESVFTSDGRAALRLGKAYFRFGETDKARYWYDMGISGNSYLNDKDRKYFRITDTPPFYSGRITGRLTFGGKPAQGVRVGLARSAIEWQLKRVAKGTVKTIKPFFDLQGLVDGTATGADGRFEFAGLGENGYVLLLSVEDGSFGTVSVYGAPGVVAISADNPSVDVGDIRLTPSGAR